MRIVDRVRLDHPRRKESKRFPTIYILEEGIATAREVTGVAQSFKSLGTRIVEQGVDDYLYENMIHRASDIFLSKSLRGLNTYQRDHVIHLIGLYQWIIEESVKLGREPDSATTDRYDYYFAKMFLGVNQTLVHKTIDPFSTEFEERLTIKNDDPEIEELVSALGY